MTDAFQCDGCGEYWEQPFRFIGLEADIEALRLSEFTLDDIPNEFYTLFDPEAGGDLCPECGRLAVETLVDLFDGGRP